MSENGNGKVMEQRIYSMENMAKSHTDQLLSLTNTVNDVKSDSVRISTMQENSSDKVDEIFRQHEAFKESQRMRSELTDKSIKELEKSIIKNTMHLAEESGRHQEREKWTRIILSLLIIASTIITVYLKP